MVKLLLLAAFVANILIVVSATAPVCHKNEVYSDCINGGCFGARNCTEIGAPVKCVKIDPAYCKKGFICADGYLRDKNGVCIPQDQCPKSQKLTCSQMGYPVPCGTISSGIDDKCPGKPAFICEDEPICGKNEEYSGCANGGCYGARNCSEIGRPIICVDLIEGACRGACLCKKGYLRNDNGVCVPQDKCPKQPICGKNEEYSDCANGGCYGARNCSEIGRPIICVDLIEGACRGACLCKDGYLRNDNGVCVPQDKCPKRNQTCTKPNEVYDLCPARCPGGTCEVDDRLVLCAPQPEVGDPDCPPPSCICKNGFYRNSNGDCVTRDECPKCDQNEVYDPCPAPCPPRRCGVDDSTIRCAAPPKLGDPECQPGCRCEDGYARTNEGRCVPRDQCPKCTGAHEVYDDCPPTCPPQTCESLTGTSYSCPAESVNKTCEGACRCESGYYRNSIGDCISKKQCQQCSGPNEYYSCGGACDNVCATLSQQNQTNCPIVNIKCNEMCYCESGYARDDNNTCIPIKKCKKQCSGPNEFYDTCPPSCPPQTCDSIGKIFHCPISTTVCKPACRCESDYYRNKNGKCIPKKDCPAVCGVNEVFSNCTQAVCRAQNCSQKGQPIACPLIAEGYCNQGCVCQENYLRAENGTCVPEDQCEPPKCSGLNEVYDTCPPYCTVTTCDGIGKPVDCPPHAEVCRPACVCRSGYYRNDQGDCVLEEDCTTVCGANEVYSECVQKKPIAICRRPGCPTPPPCQPGCECKENYQRDANGTCVPVAPPTKCTGSHEVYDNCPPICPPQTCESLNASYSCPSGSSKTCKGACRCESGYYRNSIGDCISKKQCQQCSGPNEYYSCGGACDNVCATLSQQNQTKCPYVNIKCNEMCYCESGYARNDSNICIPIEKCKSQPIACPAIAEGSCNRGCICQENYLRAENGTCIPEDQCEQPTCPEGQVYNTCPAAQCDAEYCPKTRDSPLVCTSTKNCGKPRCTCGFNQHKDRKTNKCIATADCPPFKCDGQNEEYQSCPPVCPGQNCSDYINNSTCPRFRIGIVVPCEPKCRCINNYYRNSQGKCVSGSQCKKEQTTCTTTTSTTTVAPPTGNCNNDDVQQRFSEGIADWNINFLRALVKSQNGSSVICSPFSVEVPLGELILFTNQSTESYDQLTGLLNLKNNDEISCAFKDLLKSLKSPANVTLDLAAKVYCNELYPLSSNFLQVTNDVFEAQAENVDCSNPEQAAATMNKWVEDNTNNLITDLVSPDMITPLTRLVLLNAIYYKGDWKYKFNPNDTKDRDFHVSNDKTIQVKTMYQESTHFKYGVSEELGCTILQMPYANEDFTCVIYLPDKIDGLNDLLDKLNAASMIKAQNNLKQQKTKVQIPKFELETSIDLKVILQKNNITDIFSSSLSGIDGILEKPEPLFVSAAIQKAKIILNEEGSEAAAANAVVVGTTAVLQPPPEETKFLADHPFVFLIKQKDIIIFCGAYVQ